MSTSKQYTRWSTDTGEIIDNPLLTDAALPKHNTHCTEGVWYQTEYYFKDGQPTPLMEQSTSINRDIISIDNSEALIVSNLPPEYTVYVDGPTDYKATLVDPMLIFKFVLPGVYNIKVEAFPYLPKEFTVSAN